MKTKQVLVTRGNHMRPMLAALNRYGIGAVDKYDRGRWVSINDLPDIVDAIEEDETAIVVQGVTFVRGTNQHNHVSSRDFYKLFD